MCRVTPLLLLTTLALIAQTPVVTEGGVGNAAITSTREVSPGSLVSIFGSELAPVLPPGSSVPVSVTFNNIQAPILFASPGQINTQLPWDVIPAAAETGTASIVVTRSNVASVPRQVPIRRITPGIFAVNNRAIAVNFPDGTLAQPPGALPPFDSQPARPGGVIILYANGLGPVDPPIATGATSGDGPLRFNTTTPQVLVGGQPAEVIFSGLAPQFAGVNQVNFTIPAAGIPLGDAVPLQIRVGDQITPVTVTIAIR